MGTEAAAQERRNPMHEAVLMRLRVELFSAAQLMKGADLAELRQLVGELVETLDIAPEGW